MTDNMTSPTEYEEAVARAIYENGPWTVPWDELPDEDESRIGCFSDARAAIAVPRPTHTNALAAEAEECAKVADRVQAEAAAGAETARLKVWRQNYVGGEEAADAIARAIRTRHHKGGG